MTVTVTHAEVTGAPADPTALVDGPAWDAPHVVTGLATVASTGSAADLTGTLPAASLPAPTASTLGGIKSLVAVATKWINSIGTDGTPTQTQPAFTDISGSVSATQMPALTGDITTVAGAVATTLATVNANVGSFGSATSSASFTVNAKGLLTTAGQTTITPAIGSVTGLGTNVSAFLATPSSANLRAALTDEVGTGAAYFVGGALGTPASGTLTSCTAFTLTTTGTSGAATYSAGALNIPQYVSGVTSIAGNTGAFTLSNGITNSTNDIRLNVNGLTAYTTPFRQTDYLLIYDVANSVHKKILPKDLNYGFSAHKNGTSQTGISSGIDTKVTFTTELFDVGSYYDAANSKWTPPAGRVMITALIYVTGTFTGAGSGPTVIAVWKNGAVFKEGFFYPALANNGNAPIVIIDDANGTDFYEIYVRQVVSASTATVDGTAKWSYVMGTVL